MEIVVVISGVVSAVCAVVSAVAALKTRGYRDQILKQSIRAGMNISGNGGDGIRVGKDNKNIYIGGQKVG